MADEKFLTNFAKIYRLPPYEGAKDAMGKFTQYKVQLAGLSDGHYEQDFVIDTEFFKNMENPDVLTSDVKVHLDMEKKHDAYDCTFHCKGKLTIPCDRCLDPLDHEIDTTYHIIVKYGEEYDDGADDVLVIPYANTYLNVSYLLNDTLLLTIPMRHVHPAGKCNRAMAAALNRHSAYGDRDGEEDIEDADFSDSTEPMEE